MATKAPIDVFRYRDYRSFLRDYYAWMKANDYGFSYRVFSRRAGISSPNYLKLVMDDQRNLSAEMAVKFAEVCGLDGSSADYFCELVAFNQAKTTSEKTRCYRNLARYRRYRKVYKLDRAQDAYYSQWYIPAIRELVTRGDFDEDPKWIARQLLPSITAKEAQKALSVLEELGMLVRDEDGRLVQAEALVATDDHEPLGIHVANYHVAMMERAAAAIDVVPREEREIASLTLCISEARLGELKDQLQRLRAELLQLYQPDEEAERVVQLNLQMFPLTVSPSDTDK